MIMLIDLHVHSDVSSCSQYDRKDLMEDIKSRGVKLATVTDHGSVDCCIWLSEKLTGVQILFGTELSSHEGDFLVFSAEPSYFEGIMPYVKSVSEIPRNKGVAVIWAHPRTGAERGWRAPTPSNPITTHVLKYIDGIEQANGKMLSLAPQGLLADDYEDAIKDMADRAGIALTGGSDAHSREKFFAAWTVFPDSADSPARLVEAIKDKSVFPQKSGKPALKKGVTV